VSLNLITDRAGADSARINLLKSKINRLGWDGLTDAERAEWVGEVDDVLYDSSGEQLFDLDGYTLTAIGNETAKGEYGYLDLIRVAEAVDFLANILNSYGYSVVVTAKQDWEKGEILASAEMAAYLADVQAIKDVFFGTTELPASMDFIDYADANNIEFLLLEVEGYLTNMPAAFRSCGTFACGQGGLL
jgi:hypothetical protein